MRLTALTEDEPLAEPLDPRLAGTEIAGLTADSRAVRPGFLFAALPGARADGRDFIPEALARGAVAVLAPPGVDLGPAASRTALVLDENPRRRLALMAARFHGAQPRTVAAVTGTNGKTSVATFVRQIWESSGRPAASLGTLGLAAPGDVRPGSLTTPDPVALHALLAELKRAGVEHLAMEASSHGLAQHRLDGVRIAAAAFTNLTRDHLDFHGDMAGYRAAKERLFAEVMAPGGVAVLNADSAEAGRLSALCAGRGHRVVDYGMGARAIRLDSLAARPDGLDLSIVLQGRRHAVALPLVGRFQALNVLCALGLVLGLGGEEAAALAALSHLQAVPGRMQRVATLPGGAAVYVDYAHTSDALETVLTALRPHAEGRLSVVFGCGGDRDPGKRPLMGAAAARLADAVIVTDDNPRSEDPAAIRAAVLAGCPGAREIGDRALAIAAAVEDLRPGDVLVVAGKGHERTQTVGAEVRPFDDAEVASVAAAARGGRA